MRADGAPRRIAGVEPAAFQRGIAGVEPAAFQRGIARVGPIAFQRGITLVELIAALVISALVVTLASRVFLSGQKEFLARVFETDRISALVRMKGTLHQGLGGRIATCGSGRVTLATDSADLDLAAWLKTRHPGADSLVFKCLEVDEARGELEEWKGRFQPQLVEYRVCLAVRGRTDCLAGSVLR